MVSVSFFLCPEDRMRYRLILRGFLISEDGVEGNIGFLPGRLITDAFKLVHPSIFLHIVLTK